MGNEWLVLVDDSDQLVFALIWSSFRRTAAPPADGNTSVLALHFTIVAALIDVADDRNHRTSGGRRWCEREMKPLPSIRRAAVGYIALALAGLLTMSATPGSADDAKPTAHPEIRLVLQITVDQLRGDQLDRYGARLGEGGFRRLLDSGAVYTDAHYLHANTETIVGHSTLATGTTPSVHGMTGNVWYDRNADRGVYNIEDDRYAVVGEDSSGDAAIVSGPESFARSSGRSPEALLAGTLADELTRASAGTSRVFSVALKDRAAVPMGGRSGKAVWYSRRSGRFVSSTYYFDALPQWIARFNSERRADRYGGTTWRLLAPANSYMAEHADDRPFEAPGGLFSRTFPHDYGTTGDANFYARIASSPAGDELVAELAAAAIDAWQLGQRGVVDYLAVGFSATDYVGHTFGPSSLEAEDNLRDRKSVV